MTTNTTYATFADYIKAEWLTVGRDDNGWFVRSDAAWAMTAMKAGGWKVRLTGNRQMEAGDGFRFYFEVI